MRRSVRATLPAAGQLGFGSSLVSWALLVLVTAGCTGSYETAVRADLDQASATFSRPRGQERGDHPRLGQALCDYLAYAAERSPELRAAFDRWRASVQRISPARQLPDPMLELGVFVWNSGDNEGLTPARAGLRQELPWPTKLTDGADAASADARALQRRFEAQLLELRQRVTEAYLRLWLLRRTRTIEREQLEILRGISESTLGRMATGVATLADQQQIDLAAARLADAIAGLDQQERAAQAQLRALVGAPADADTPTAGEPPGVALPAETESALRRAASHHPFIASFALLGDAADAAARREGAARLPGFVVGVEWMRMPGPMGEGAIMPSLGVRLPLWQGSYRQRVRAAEAEAAARRAEGQAATQRAQAELEEALASLYDSSRRVALNERTLLPQAKAAHASVLGAYATGRSTAIASLVAQRELLEVRLGLERARAEHAAAWARLEQVVGRAVERRATPRGGRDD